MHRRGYPSCRVFLLAYWTALAGSSALAHENDKPATTAVGFDEQVLPILQTACLRCHGEKQRKGELDLRSPPAMLRGGNGGAAIEPHKADDSLLIQMIASGEMPPEKQEPRVTAAQLEVLKTWINAGASGPKNPVNDSSISAEDRKHWSFVRPVKPAPPAPSSADRIRTPIDSFISQRLEEAGLQLNPEADRRVLVRRLSLDLLGLPPPSDEVEAFLNDPRDDAYDQLVDSVLESPHYGERWARHWLDTVGYADSNGRRLDEERQWAWRYRDYVIRSLNSDKPYDRFVVEQLAGDELLDWRSAPTLSPEMVENLVATGFLRTARDATDTAKVDMTDDNYMTLHDTVEVAIHSLLGLTIGCAKCHSHKYDPIPQNDYYRLAAFFTPAYNPENWIPANHRGVVPEEQLRYLKEATPAELQVDATVNGAIDGAVAELKKSLAALKSRHRERLKAAALARLPAAVQGAFAKAPERRTVEEQELVAQYEKKVAVSDQQLQADAESQQALKPMEAAIAAADAARLRRPLIWALWDLDPRPPETRLLIRGDFRTPGSAVEPGVLSVLDDPENPFEIRPPAADANTTGYRTQLARWIVDQRNPLTARVIANRVWRHHFGRGLVATVNDFGKTGTPPTHPELLDWLAVDFMEQGWSLKALHRRIVLSATYRQSAEVDEEKARVDPENTLWWRKPPLRLEGEVLRDALLAVAGRLNFEMYGPGVPVKQAADGQWIAAGSDSAARRRSIYLLNKRTESVTFLTTFDAPQMELDCPQRFHATVVQQSLAMFNNPFVVEQAENLAAWIAASAPSDTPGTARRAFEQVLGRLPDKSELAALSEFLEAELARASGPDGRKQALFQLAHTLLNTNEFLYVD